jgi:glyoxylate reductase
MARVLVTRHLPDAGLEPLLSAGHILVRRADDVPYSTKELAGTVPDVEGILCLLTDHIDESVLRAGAKGSLRVVSNAGVGYDNVDVVAARRLGIAVCNTPGVLDQTTADLAFLLVLAATRLASEAERDLRAGRWHGWGFMDHLAHDVHGGVLGIVGYGRIGRAVARRAEGFGMEVLHHSRTATGFPGYVGTLEDLLATADVVSLHVPLTQATHHLIGSRELSLMKPSGVLVNTARGQVVDEDALCDALEAGTIFAAGLDVYEDEPTVNPRILAAPRTVLLPHIGSATARTRTRMARLAAQGVCDVLAGRTPPNLVTA